MNATQAISTWPANYLWASSVKWFPFLFWSAWNYFKMHHKSLLCLDWYETSDIYRSKLELINHCYKQIDTKQTIHINLDVNQFMDHPIFERSTPNLLNAIPLCPNTSTSHLVLRTMHIDLDVNQYMGHPRFEGSTPSPPKPVKTQSLFAQIQAHLTLHYCLLSLFDPSFFSLSTVFSSPFPLFLSLSDILYIDISIPCQHTVVCTDSIRSLNH